MQKENECSKNIKLVVTLGASLICASSALATQQILMKHWPILFTIGFALITIAFIFGSTRKIFRGFVNVDREETKSIFLRGKRIKG